MATEKQTSSAVMLEDELQAGFLTPQRGNPKEFAAFEVQPDTQQAIFRRTCTREEKKKLSKLVYGQKAVRSIRCKTSVDGEDCLLFVTR